jgi:hypothetical protein
MTPQSHEVKKPVKLSKPKKKESWRNHQGQKRAEKQTTTCRAVCVVFAIFSAFCNVNLHCGDRTSRFA